MLVTVEKTTAASSTKLSQPSSGVSLNHCLNHCLNHWAAAFADDIGDVDDLVSSLVGAADGGAEGDADIAWTPLFSGADSAFFALCVHYVLTVCALYAHAVSSRLYAHAVSSSMYIR